MTLGGAGFTHELAHHGETDEWLTPPWIFDALGITFTLDPCSAGPGKDFVPAITRYTAKDDGLALPWFGTCWCNPPYGPKAAAWLDKLARHGDGIAFIYARTDTAWFQRVAPKAHAVCFIAGRVRFHRASTKEIAKHNPGAPSCLLGFGHGAGRVVADCGLGLVTTLWKTP
jgi:hypothetical protein